MLKFFLILLISNEWPVPQNFYTEDIFNKAEVNLFDGGQKSGLWIYSHNLKIFRHSSTPIGVFGHYKNGLKEGPWIEFYQKSALLRKIYFFNSDTLIWESFPMDTLLSDTITNIDHYYGSTALPPVLMMKGQYNNPAMFKFFQDEFWRNGQIINNEFSYVTKYGVSFAYADEIGLLVFRIDVSSDKSIFLMYSVIGGVFKFHIAFQVIKGKLHGDLVCNMPSYLNIPKIHDGLPLARIPFKNGVLHGVGNMVNLCSYLESPPNEPFEYVFFEFRNGRLIRKSQRNLEDINRDHIRITRDKITIGGIINGRHSILCIHGNSFLSGLNGFVELPILLPDHKTYDNFFHGY